MRGGDPWVGAELPVDPDVDLHRDRVPRVRRELPVLGVIALGGGLGSVARELVERAAPAGDGLPVGTFLINVTGSLALGVVLVLVLQVWHTGRYARPFLAVGVLGGFTTFSTFAVEIHQLLARGRWTLGDGYAIGSVLAGLAAVWLGMAATRRFAPDRPGAATGGSPHRPSGSPDQAGGSPDQAGSGTGGSPDRSGGSPDGVPGAADAAAPGEAAR